MLEYFIKSLIRIISMVLFLGIFIAIMFLSSYFGSNEPSPAQVQRRVEEQARFELIKAESSNRYAYSQLTSESEKDFYVKIVRALEDLRTGLSVPYSNKDWAFKVFEYVLTDYPEMFWVKTEATFVTRLVNGSPSGYRLDFKYIDDGNKEIIQQKQIQIDQKTESIINYLNNFSTEHDQAKGLYEYLIRNTVYDENIKDQSMYSVLVRGRGVCAGYARSFQYLMNKIEIQSTVITGDLKNQSKPTTSVNHPLFSFSTGHAWNLVRIGDDWYHVDVTSGEAFSSEKIYSYEFFLLSSDEIRRTHTINSTMIIP